MAGEKSRKVVMIEDPNETAQALLRGVEVGLARRAGPRGRDLRLRSRRGSISGSREGRCGGREATMKLILDNLNLEFAEKLLCTKALEETGTIVEAAQLLGCTRGQLKRKIIKHKIEWPRGYLLRAKDGP